MPLYRLTIRYGSPHRYHMADIEAVSLEAALRDAASQVPEAAGDSADVVELRRMADPDTRQYGPG
jgi:hypothetical protein